MFDTMIVTGFIAGALLFAAFAILLEKLPKWLRRLALGHYLATDILFTILSFVAFPVVGVATLISAAVFCLLMTLYLVVRRQTQPYTRIQPGGSRLIQIINYDPESSNK